MRMSVFKRNAVEFRGHTSGSTGILFALAAIPMFIAAGCAVDYARAQSTGTRVQTAVDSAALAAAVSGNLTNTQRVELAKKTFHQNLKTKYTSGINIDAKPLVTSGEVTVSSKFSYPTTFMKLAGINSVNVNKTATAMIDASKEAEIALVLDYSGSMNDPIDGKSKYVIMRDAAIKMVQDSIDENKQGKIKYGLVPFSHHVYTDLPGKFVVGGQAGKTWTGCTVDRQFPYNTTAKSPKRNVDKSKWGQPQAAVHASWGCQGYIDNDLKVRPISSDYDGVISQLQKMTPYAWTHIAVGFSFGWQLLSKNAPFTKVAAKADKNHLKYLVLLTDGAQTEPAFGANGYRGNSSNDPQGGKNLERSCANAKKDGITVVTVAFDLDDPDTVNRLRDCSSDPSKYFFNATSSSSLRNVFEEIKSRITNSVYLSN